MLVQAVERFRIAGLNLNLHEIFVWYFEQKGVENAERFLGGVNDAILSFPQLQSPQTEITDINKIYLSQDKLDVMTLEENVAWLDAGTKDSLIESTIAIRDLEKAHDRKYGSPDIEAYKNRWISKDQLLTRASELHPSDYAKDLLKFAKAANTKNAKR